MTDPISLITSMFLWLCAAYLAWYCFSRFLGICSFIFELLYNWEEIRLMSLGNLLGSLAGFGLSFLPLVGDILLPIVIITNAKTILATVGKVEPTEESDSQD